MIDINKQITYWSNSAQEDMDAAYDLERTLGDYEKLWMYAASTDSRIEPIPEGEQLYLEDDSNVIIEIARREG